MTSNQAHALWYIRHHPFIICTCPGTIAANCTHVSDWACFSKIGVNDPDIKLGANKSVDVWSSKTIRVATKNVPLAGKAGENDELTTKRIDAYVDESSPLLQKLLGEGREDFKPDQMPTNLIHVDETGLVDKVLLYQK